MCNLQFKIFQAIAKVQAVSIKAVDSGTAVHNYGHFINNYSILGVEEQKRD